MLKSLQLEELTQEGFHYVTAITKPHDTLLRQGVLQPDLFEETLGEVLRGSPLPERRNPQRAA